MGRTDQGAEFDAILAGSGFESRWLLDVRLPDGGALYLSDAAITLDSHVYQVEITEPPEIGFSKGANADGFSEVVLQNADSAYSVMDETAVSLLEGATAVVRYAVSIPGADAWEVDTIAHVKFLHVLPNQAEARVTMVSDMFDVSKVMSGETGTIEELSPVAAGLPQPLPAGFDAGTGYRVGGHFGRRGRYADILNSDYRPSV